MINSREANGPVILEQRDGYSRATIQRGIRPTWLIPVFQRHVSRVKNKMGNREDWFEVYRGRIPYPLDTFLFFDWVNRDLLDAARVAAVEQFRKMIEDAERELSKKH
jgi:hypothetical protein